MGNSLLDSTLEPLVASAVRAQLRAPALTVAYHPDPERVGQCARLTDLLERRPVSLSRLEPLFGPVNGAGAEPLADRCLSRTPLCISPAPRGALRISSATGWDALVDGDPLAGGRVSSDTRDQRSARRLRWAR